MNGFHQYQSCIEACLQCAAICYYSAQLMSLGSSKAQEICRICADICQECGDEWLNMKQNIVRNVQEHVGVVQKNAERWHHDITNHCHINPISSMF